MNQTGQNGKKTLVLGSFFFLAQIWAANFFFKNMASSVTRYHHIQSYIIYTYHHKQYQRKLVIQS